MIRDLIASNPLTTSQMAEMAGCSYSPEFPPSLLLGNKLLFHELLPLSALVR
ncbi:hypothetical protein BJY00DRAFT_286522 [Aspergillus carlsbadensis]|nr:hypothetical protein BJY00DRAFT_286522 [Aspergillus carlsbadensis]